MSNVRVLVSDKLAEAGLDVLREASGIELEFRPGMRMSSVRSSATTMGSSFGRRRRSPRESSKLRTSYV